MKKIIIMIIIFSFLSIQSHSLACTGFTASEEDQVLFGNNEDWFDPDPYIKIYPAETNKYGKLLIEFEWPPENPRYFVSFTGINDKGLCFDSFLHPPLRPTESSNKPYFSGDLMEHCLEKCSTVDEVIQIFNLYNLGFMENFQYFIVDRFGNSAIIEGDEIIYKDGIYQVVTNFLQSDPSHGWFPCWRYNTAVDMLENMLDFSVGYFTEICNATHQEGSYPTVYSYVNDLENNIMYLYHYYDYDKVVVLDVNDEISRGEHTYYLPDLFLEEENNPPNTPYKINGEIRGKINREYEYTTNTIDPDGDKIFFIFDWDDGSKSEWLGPYDSEENIVISHTWNVEGEYEIRVKAKDIYGYESEWSDPLYISMPINKRLDLNLINFKIPYLKLNWLIRYILN